jgi:hypothetical protein
MTKTTKKRSARSKKSPARRRNRPVRKNDPSAEATTRSDTKQCRAIEMLRSKEGASISALMEATGWQQHSVRGFLAGVVRKRLMLNLVSAVDAGVRTYRITGEPAAPSSKVQRAQSKSS